MSRVVTVLKLVAAASIVTIAAFAVAFTVSIGLGHTQAMMEVDGFSRMENHYTNHSNSTLCADGVSLRMNMTQHMGGNIYEGHEAMHSQLNMTEHVQDMHGGNMTTSNTESNHRGCHD